MAKSLQFALIAVVLVAAGLGAQTKPTPKPTLTPKPAAKPNFTGRWAVVSPTEAPVRNRSSRRTTRR